MASELTPTYDSDTGQVVLEGLPTGAAGGAGLVPVPGLELVFDRTDGRLARAVIDTAQLGSPISSGEAAHDVLKALFGPRAPAMARDAAAQRRIQRALSPDAHLSATWSRLARLESARATSPVPASPLWAAEAAQLAKQTGLHGRARAEARRAATGLAELLSHTPLLPEALSQAALAVADIIETEEPGAAGQLRDYARKLPAGSLEQWHAEQAGASPPPGAVQGGSPGTEKEQIPGLRWSFDPGLIPEGVFLPGLSPLTDLIVRPGGGRDRVIVEALLAPGADRDVLSRCRARLVDPSARRVLASAPFVPEESQVRAELTPPFPIDELKESWVEVVDDEQRPVRSEQLRRTRRALRWADAALRAEQRPQGLAPQFTGQDWTALAAMAWERCSYDWEDTGDTDRAFLAARRLAVLNPAARVPEPPSAWTADLASPSPLQEPPFLAEAIGR
jgi:hypothetical protein